MPDALTDVPTIQSAAVDFLFVLLTHLNTYIVFVDVFVGYVFFFVINLKNRP